MTSEHEMDDIDKFLFWLRRHTERKAELYDGFNSKLPVDEFFRYAGEELGEVSSAITRERWELVQAECIDLAHCAFLIYQRVKELHLDKES